MNGEGGSGSFVILDNMLFQSLYDACDEMRRLRDSPTLCRNGRVIDRKALREKLSPWQRGQFVNSAGTIQELSMGGKWQIPSAAVEMSEKVLRAEEAYLDELQAAAVAGSPWIGTFRKERGHERDEECMRCGDLKSSWRFILKAPPNMPVEMSWRLSRPENAVPLCRRCAEVVKFREKEDIRFDLAWGLWSSRFEALHRWYLAVQYNWLPKNWDKTDYPLWPKELGGSTWKEGSGSFVYSTPRPAKGVLRQQVHYAALNRAMGVGAKRREEIGNYFSALQLKRVVPDPDLAPGEYYCERGCFYRESGTCYNCPRGRNRDPE